MVPRLPVVLHQSSRELGVNLPDSLFEGCPGLEAERPLNRAEFHSIIAAVVGLFHRDMGLRVQLPQDVRDGRQAVIARV